jgi:hypothetical protein
LNDSDFFKHDIRIRERMLRRGFVTESEVARHLEGLADAESKSETLDHHQPALGYGDEDDEDDDDDEATS